MDFWYFFWLIWCWLLPARSRLGRRRRSKLFFERLEQRSLLATIDIELNLYADDNGSPGALLSNEAVVAGQSFFLEIVVQDTSTVPSGVTSLALDANWVDAIFDETDSPFNPADPARIVTFDFPLLRGGTLNNSTATIDELRGSSLPGLGQGQAIGIAGHERFAILRFITQAAGVSPINLAIGVGGVTFADASSLDSADIESQQITVFPGETLYVNDQFVSGAVDGDLEAAGVQNAIVGVNAFASVADALTAFPSYAGNIIVNGGTYDSALLASGGNVTLQLVQDLLFLEPDALFEDISSSAADEIVTRFHNVAGGNVIVEQGSFPGEISGAGNLVKTSAGTMTLSGVNTYTGLTNVDGGTLQLQNGSAILDTAGAVNVGLGGTLQLLSNETISSYIGAGEAGAGSNDSMLALDSHTLTTTGNAAVANVITANGLLIAGGSITDADDDNNVTGSGIALQAATGIGTALDPLEMTLATVAANSSTEGVFLFNTGNLAIGSVGPLTGVACGLGDLSLVVVGSLTVNDFVNASSGVELTTIDAPTTGQDIIVSAGSSVSAAALSLNAGDDLIIAGNVQSDVGPNLSVDWRSDSDVPSADPIGGVFTLTSLISDAFVYGNSDDDVFNMMSQTVPGFIFGFGSDGPTGDVLNIDLTAASDPTLTVYGPGAGIFSGGLWDVTYFGIAEINGNAPYHLILDANLNPFGNTGVSDLVTMRQNGANLVIERTGSAGAPDNDDLGVIFQGTGAPILSFSYIGSSDDDILTVSDAGGLPQFLGAVPLAADNLNLAGNAAILFAGLGGSNELEFELTGGDATVAYAIGNGLGVIAGEGEVHAGSNGQVLQAYFQQTELVERTGIGATPGALSILGDTTANNIAILASGPSTLISPTGYTPFSFTGNNFSSIAIHGLSGSDTLSLINLGTGQTNHPSITLDGGFAPDPISFGGSNPDTLRIHSTSGNSGIVTLLGGTGSDLFQLFDAANTVDNIAGPVVIDGLDGNIGGNSDVLMIVDSGDFSGDSVLLSAVNPSASPDYGLDGITNAIGYDVIFRNIDVLNYTGTSGNDTIDAQFVSTAVPHDLSQVNLSGWVGGDQFLLFTSDQMGGSGPLTPTGIPSVIAIINLYGDAPGNPNGGDGSDIFGETPAGLTGIGAANVGLVVADSTRLIRPNVTTALHIDGGTPTGTTPPNGDEVGDVLNLDISGLPNTVPMMVATFAPGTIIASGIQPLTWVEVEDINLVDQAKLTSVQMGDSYLDLPVNIDSVTGLESSSGTTPLGFTVSLNQPFVLDVSVPWKLTHGNTSDADFDPSLNKSGIVTILAGDLSAVIPFAVLGENIVELDETFTVTIGDPDGPGVVLAESKTGTGTIQNDDSATVTLTPISRTEGDAGTADMVFTVTLSNPLDTTMMVDFSTLDGTATTANDDYIPTNQNVVFIPGGPLSQTINVPIRGDAAIEADESFTAMLSNVQAGGRNATAGTAVTGTIINDDLDMPILTIDDMTANEGSDGTTTSFTFAVTLSHASTSTIQVQVDTKDVSAIAPGDYETITGLVLTFIAGETTQTVTVKVVADKLIEPIETFQVNLSKALGANIGDSTGIGTILNDDMITATITRIVTQMEGNAGTTNYDFTVTLDGAAATDVVIPWEFAHVTSNDADFGGLTKSGKVTIPAGQLSAQITPTFLAAGDNLGERDETFTVTLGTPETAAVKLAVDAIGFGVIRNDDFANISIIGPPAVAEGNAGSTSSTFTITLSQSVDVDLTIDYQTQDGTAAIADNDYQSAAGIITFIAGTAGSLQIPIAVFGDANLEADEDFSLLLSNLSPAALGPNLIVNGSFETPASSQEFEGVGPGSSLYPGWAVTQGTVDFTRSFWQAADGVRSVDLDGSPGIGGISQTFVTVPGQMYRVEFDFGANFYGGAGLKRMLVTTGLQSQIFETDAAGRTPQDFGWELETWEFFATSTSTTLEFRSLSDQLGIANGQANWGPVIDAIAVREILAPTITFEVEQAATIANDDVVLPEVDIADVAILEGNAGETFLVFTISLSQANPSSDVIVEVSTADITALAGTDYTALTNQAVTIAKNTTSQTVTVKLTGDTLIEKDETFKLSITKIDGAKIGDGEAIGTITNDDTATASIDSVTVIEGNSGATNFDFTVTIDNKAAFDVVIPWAFANGTTLDTDFGSGLTKSGKVTIPAGSTSAKITPSFPVNGDTALEKNETFTVTLGTPEQTEVTLSPTNIGIGTITNDDQVTVSINDLNDTEPTVGGTKNFDFTVTLSQTAEVDVVVPWSFANVTSVDADFGANLTKSGKVTIPAGQSSASISGVFPVAGDLLDEVNETFTVTLGTPETTSAVLSASAKIGTGTIVDLDIAVVASIDSKTLAEGNTSTTAIEFTVSLDKASPVDVVIPWTFANGTTLDNDFSSLTKSGKVAIPANQLAAKITFNVNGDSVLEGNENFTVTLGTPETPNSSLNNNAKVGTGMINNDDQVIVTINSVNDVEPANGNTKNFDFTITLSAAADIDVVVPWTFSNGTTVDADFGAWLTKSGKVTIPAGSTSAKISGAFPVAGDLFSEVPAEIFTVALQTPETDGAVLGNDKTGTGTINDVTTVVASIDNKTLAEGNSGTTAFDFTVTLDNVSAVDVVIPWTFANGTTTDVDFGAGLTKSGKVTIPAGQTKATIPSLPVNGDTLVELDETFTVTLGTPETAGIILSSTSKIGTGTVQNDDTAPPPPGIDLSINKTVNNAAPNVGQGVVFTIVVGNVAGMSTATNVAVTDLLPAGLAFVSAATSQGAYAGSTGVWLVGDLSAGGTATLLISATITEAGTISNAAEVTAADQTDADSTPGNFDIAPVEDDEAAATLQGIAAETESIDLEIRHSIDTELAVIGQAVIITIEVRNQGATLATGVVVAGSWPGNLLATAFDSSSGSFNSSTGLWNLGSLPAGGVATLRMVGIASSAAEFSSTAEIVAADQPDVDSFPRNDPASTPAEDDIAVVTVRTAAVQTSEVILPLEKPPLLEARQPAMPPVVVILPEQESRSAAVHEEVIPGGGTLQIVNGNAQELQPATPSPSNPPSREIAQMIYTADADQPRLLAFDYGDPPLLRVGFKPILQEVPAAEVAAETSGVAHPGNVGQGHEEGPKRAGSVQIPETSNLGYWLLGGGGAALLLGVTCHLILRRRRHRKQ